MQPALARHLEALLIFYGKASVSLRALGRAFPEQWTAWIG